MRFWIPASPRFSWQQSVVAFCRRRRVFCFHSSVSKGCADLLSGGRGRWRAGGGRLWQGWEHSHCWAWLGPTRAALPSGVTTTRASPARGQGGVRPYPTMQPLGPYRALMGPLCLGPPAPVITAQSLASPLSWCRAAAAPTPGLGLGGGGSAAAASRCSQVEPSIEVQPHCATCHAPAQTICLPVLKQFLGM